MSAQPFTHYAERNPRQLEPHYTAHILAMTREDLHSKSEIAAELAWRDQQIAELRAQVSAIHHAINDAGWHPGRTDDLLTDIIRRKGDEFAELRAQVEALSKPDAEPALFVSPGQLNGLLDPEGPKDGRYLPVRKTPAGLFTTPLYTRPAPQPLTRPAVPEGWRKGLLDAFPLLKDAGLDEDKHHCE